ncbi:hypothetical protein [Helicobacter cetorum]|uniref:hypothetical protein n=1 Tax=Helicobacter cetorum TaxID=138563 RepID=UPI001F359B56|nr:hypothetical protein [Helicobacter cetorum]
MPSEYRKVYITNKHQKTISELIEYENVGAQIDISQYLTFKSGYYLGTISCMNSLIYDGLKGENISPIIYQKSPKKLQKGDIVISRNASLGKISFINDNSKIILNGGLSVLKIKDLFKYYVSAFFVVDYGTEYLTCLTSGGGTQQNAKRQNLLDVPIPFPTINNNQKPQDIETLVSLIVQNIIDKEQQIKNKNTLIDDLIEEELQTNQQQNSFSYSYPTINEIKEETRLDTGLYEKEFKKMDFLIRNYENGFFKLLSKYEASRGQNLQVSNIGESIYSETQKDNFYRLFTNVELSDDRTISNYRWLGNKNKLKLIPPKTIFLSADGTVGRCIYLSNMSKTITNIHPWNINRIRKTESEFEDVFVAMFLGFLYKKNFYEKIKDKANGGGIKLNHLERYIKIPNFPKYKQQEIAKEYYNPLGKNNNILTLQNYLEKEKERNKNIGIFQLNMEIFELKERLSDLIHKIITEEKIEIVLDY